jgi:hypothetical protein
MFRGATNFNQNVNVWNTGSASNFESMFENASGFIGPLTNWTMNAANNVTRMLKGSVITTSNVNTYAPNQQTKATQLGQNLFA